MSRPPFPPFTEQSAVQKIRAAEDGWNGRDPAKVALAYTPDSGGGTGRSSSTAAARSRLS
jgi:nuclear transport factor 2 (NTF2) superfamily protein